ncbi:MAG: hypothetical protein ACOX4J_07405 [Anaerovoracaceae bacterium]|jgi:hypothetical protein
MNKIKDFIYDKNDLLIALLIVLAATFVILSRIEVIMAYPSTLVAETEAGEGEVVSQLPYVPPENANEDEQSSEEGQSEDTSGDQEDPPQIPPEDPGDTDSGNTDTGVSDPPTNKPSADYVSINIEYGSTGSDIAQLLINAGLIPDRQTFYNAVEAAGADTKLQAGNFRIPSNATPEEIIRIITNTN